LVNRNQFPKKGPWLLGGASFPKKGIRELITQGIGPRKEFNIFGPNLGTKGLNFSPLFNGVFLYKLGRFWPRKPIGIIFPSHFKRVFPPFREGNPWLGFDFQFFPGGLGPLSLFKGVTRKENNFP